MTVVYTEATLNLMPLEQVKELASRGELKKIENEDESLVINYLKIEELTELGKNIETTFILLSKLMKS